MPPGSVVCRDTTVDDGDNALRVLMTLRETHLERLCTSLPHAVRSGFVSCAHETGGTEFQGGTASVELASTTHG